ncbi:TIGR01777 family oxidoreductase [Catellatospora sp. NPDC049609]|uniref:TIGR01777 family oxidoreductase n=1 Tax=Catellatospora sp. NPDC049609 TaxID=3155505 RepID=UPI00342F1B9C
MRIVVSGASGFLGKSLLPTLRSAGHEVIQLVRRPAADPSERQWDPAEPIRLPEGTDAVVNLCGVGVGDRRWTEEYQALILSSRVVPTATLARAVAAQRIPVLVNASGVGYYGDTGEREVTELSPPGDDFLAGVSIHWEQATAPAVEAGARVVLLRTGYPLHRDGGFLKAQLVPFKMGLGGRLGNGRQWVPWISLYDWLGAAQFVLEDDRLEGPVNMVGPAPVTNAQFTRAFGAELHRPTVMPIPKAALKILYGEFGNEAYRSLRVMPGALTAASFPYRHRTVSQALHAALTDPVPA